MNNRSRSISLHHSGSKSLENFKSSTCITKKPDSNSKFIQEENSKYSKWANMLMRIVTGLLLIACLVVTVMTGPIYVIIGIFFLQMIVFREVISIAYSRSKERKLPWFRSTMWYFLATSVYFLYGDGLTNYFSLQHFSNNNKLLLLNRHHRLISFLLYSLGIIFFVLNLKPGQYKFQFGQFGLTHMTLLLVVFQSQFFISNIFEGLFWFVVPASLVVCNDMAAYFVGLFWGKHKLIKISPKKTWEGFIGGAFITLIFGFFIARLLAPITYLTRPIEDIESLWQSWWNFYDKNTLKSHHANPTFLFDEYQLISDSNLQILANSVFNNFLDFNLLKSCLILRIASVQFHTVVLALFASAIAPFGGFFASGFKRAFKIKDFAESLPGHGGMTDRMDCQFLMGFFSYLYYGSFIALNPVNIESIFKTIVQKLNHHQQIELHHLLSNYLDENS